jgi:alkylation response protein AidB-like acyl-CoA dehydrogenase
MNYPDLDVNLTEEQRAAQDMARRFAMEVARPKGIELDAFPDPQQVIDKGSPLWDAVKTYRELGLHKRGLPASMGGLVEEMDPLSNLLINEQVGYGDSGLAISFGAAGSPFAYAAMMEDPEMRGWAEDYANDTSGEIIGCWAVMEPDQTGSSPAKTMPATKSLPPMCAPSRRAITSTSSPVKRPPGSPTAPLPPTPPST